MVPCSPQHKSCSPSHSALVNDYRDARIAAENIRDDITLGYETERKEYDRDIGIVTFGSWLKSHRR